jgi:hypothetical protein
MRQIRFIEAINEALMELLLSKTNWEWIDYT